MTRANTEPSPLKGWRGMAVWKVDIQYQYQTEYWTNKFYFNVASLAAAETATNNLAAILRTAVQNSVTVQKARLTPAPFTRDTFTDVALNLVGTGGGTAPAPLFNVVRWDWSKDTGRAIHHYFRGGVTPGNIGADQKFTSDAITFNQAICAAIADLDEPPTDKDGVAYTHLNANQFVGMHQLRRGSKRRSTPVI